MSENLRQNLRVSQRALRSLSSTLKEAIDKSDKSSNGYGLTKWFDLVKLKDAVGAMVDDLLEVEKVIDNDLDVTDTDKRA
jgi:hypothetical protein